MRKFFILIVILVFSMATSTFAQETPEGEEGTEEGTEEVAEEALVPSTEEDLEVGMGNILFINAGLNYKVLGLPYYSLGVGFDFKLADGIMLAASLSMSKESISAGTTYPGATTVLGGELNYVDIGLAIRFFLSEAVWFSTGFVYQIFSNGFYIDQAATLLHTVLDNTDVTDKLIIQLGLGIYAPVATSVYIIPGFNVKYSLPTTSSFTFAASDIVVSLNIGLGIQLFK